MKLGVGWTGPYLVTREISPLNLEIQLKPAAKPKVVHIDTLKLRQQDGLPEPWVGTADPPHELMLPGPWARQGSPPPPATPTQDDEPLSDGSDGVSGSLLLQPAGQ